MYTLIYSSLHLIPDSGEKVSIVTTWNVSILANYSILNKNRKKGAWASQTWVLSDNKIPTKLGTSQQRGQNIAIKEYANNSITI